MKVRAGHVGLRVVLETQVEGEDVEHVQVLSLVFMDAFHEHVEERLWRNRDAGALGDQRGEPTLVRELHLAPMPLELGVVSQRFELPQSIQMLQPAVADARSDQFR